jgi:hypothetical protein
MRNDDFLVLLAIGYFFLGVFQLILALVFTIRRSVLNKGFRGWIYYWIAVGVYFAGMFGIWLLFQHHYNSMADEYTSNGSEIAVGDNFDHWSKRAELLQLILGVWFFTSTLIAIYFFFAGKVSDRFALRKQNHIHN